MAIQAFLSLLLIFLTVGPALAQDKFPFTAETVSDHVNVRSGQNNNFETVAVLNKGERVIVLGKSFNWYQIRLPENAKAFVKADYVSVLSPELGEVTADRVNVRAAPNTNATILGQVKKGKTVLVKEKLADGWFSIRPVDEAVGWVHQTLVVFKSNQVVLSTVNGAEALALKKVAAVKKEESRPAPAQAAAFFKKLDNGQVECSGALLAPEAGGTLYKITRDNASVCFVDGPSSALKPFVNARVIVQGKLKEENKAFDAPVVALAKIKLAF